MTPDQDDRRAVVIADDDGTLHIICARGHAQTVKPARVWTEDDGEQLALYGSGADYCGGCESDPDYDGSAALDW